MKSLIIVLFAVALILSAQIANASFLFDNFPTADVNNAAPAGVTATAGTLGYVGGINGGAVTFNLASPATVVFTVSDLFLVGDVFEFLVDGVSQGLTSGVPIGGSTYSTGTFTVALSAGDHTYDVWDFILSYIGETSPYGGDVTSSYSPATLDVYANATAIATAPIPAALPLFASGLLALSIPVLRCRKTNA
jgi:hypothetical protein